MSEDSAIVRYYLATINISPYLHVETIIYHKENENNPLKSWPTRLVEYVRGCRDCESGQCANTNWHREINKVNLTGDPAYLRRSCRRWNHHGKSIGSTYFLGLPYRKNSFQGMGHCETSSVKKTYFNYSITFSLLRPDNPWTYKL